MRSDEDNVSSIGKKPENVEPIPSSKYVEAMFKVKEIALIL